MSPLGLLAVTGFAALGGMVNSIAGGGTLLTFPALVGLGVPPLVANATSTVALWPGALSSMLGYRSRLHGLSRWALAFAIPSVVGGAFGAGLLLVTSEERFRLIVPWLVLGATVLFAVQGSLVRYSVGRAASEKEEGPPRHSAATLLCQLGVAVYGGYFGAGIGILMLAVLGLMGFSDIHTMNAMKNWGALCMNLVAALIFAASGLVDWTVAVAMAAGSTGGGYLAARFALRVPHAWVRRAIIVVGAVSGVYLFAAPAT